MKRQHHEDATATAESLDRELTNARVDLAEARLMVRIWLGAIRYAEKKVITTANLIHLKSIEAGR